VGVEKNKKKSQKCGRKGKKNCLKKKRKKLCGREFA
jgi:hypothetical protein